MCRKKDAGFLEAKEVQNKKILIGLVLFLIIILVAGCPPRQEPPSSIDLEKQNLQRQINSDYRNPELHYKLGKLYQVGGFWVRAEQEFRIALNFDPVHKPSQAALVKTLFDSGQSVKAKETATFFMDFASPSETASLELGIYLQNENLDDNAFTCYQRALNLAPKSAKVNKHLGFFYLKKGDKENAKRYLIESFNANPYQPDVATELGKLGVPIEIVPLNKNPALSNPDK